MHAAGLVSVKWASFHHPSPAFHPLARYHHASAITLTPASIMFPTTAFLPLLLSCLHLLLYHSQFMFSILLQFSNPATLPQLRTPSLPLTLIFQLLSLASTPTNLRPVLCYVRSPISFQLHYQLCLCFHYISELLSCYSAPLSSSSKPFPVLPRLPPTLCLVLTAALSNSAPISSITSLISIFSLSLMLLLLPPNLSLAHWLTQSLLFGQFLLLLTSSQPGCRHQAYAAAADQEHPILHRQYQFSSSVLP
jgi:hypothetical protein